MSDFVGNKIWVGGVEIGIMSGDVSALHQDLLNVMEAGGGWFNFSTPDGYVALHVSPSTEVVVHYRG